MPQMPGTGTSRLILSADPAASNEASIVVPERKIWRFIAGSVRLTTNATAANRRVRFTINDGIPSNGPLIVMSPRLQVASESVVYELFPGAPADTVLTEDRLRIPLPSAEMYLHGGWQFATVTTNLQVGDDYGKIFLWVEEF